MSWRISLWTIASVSLLLGTCSQELRWERALLHEDNTCTAAAWTALLQSGAGARSARKLPGSLASARNSSAHAAATEDFVLHKPLLSPSGMTAPEQQGMLVRMRSHIWSLADSDIPQGGQQAVLAALIAAGLLVLALAAFLVVQAATSSELFSDPKRRPLLAPKPLMSSAGGGGGFRRSPAATSQLLRGAPVPGSAPDSRLPTTLKTVSHSASARSEFTGVPILCPELIMPTMPTGLAVPVVPLHLQDSNFLFDVLGLSGPPLLTAAASTTNSGKRCVEIRLHDVGTLLAIVTQDLRIFTGDGSLAGSLLATPAMHLPGEDARVQYVLRDTSGHKVLSINPAKSLQEVEIMSLRPDGSKDRELSRVTRRPAGNLPAEHYEIVVSPDTDAILQLSCFLAISLFAMPLSMQSPSTATLLPVPSSRFA